MWSQDGWSRDRTWHPACTLKAHLARTLILPWDPLTRQHNHLSLAHLVSLGGRWLALSAPVLREPPVAHIGPSPGPEGAAAPC